MWENQKIVKIIWTPEIFGHIYASRHYDLWGVNAIALEFSEKKKITKWVNSIPMNDVLISLFALNPYITKFSSPVPRVNSESFYLVVWVELVLEFDFK